MGAGLAWMWLTAFVVPEDMNAGAGAEGPHAGGAVCAACDAGATARLHRHTLNAASVPF